MRMNSRSLNKPHLTRPGPKMMIPEKPKEDKSYHTQKMEFKRSNQTEIYKPESPQPLDRSKKYQTSFSTIDSQQSTQNQIKPIQNQVRNQPTQIQKQNQNQIQKQSQVQIQKQSQPIQSQNQVQKQIPEEKPKQRKKPQKKVHFEISDDLVSEIRKEIKEELSTPIEEIVSNNTHDYDAKLIQQYANNELLKKEINEDEMLEEFEVLKFNINLSSHPQKLIAIKGLEMIMKNIGTAQNIDETNKMNAEKLLYYVSKGGDEMLDDIIVQLSDMVISGSCPQGRCTRLAQLFFSLDSKN